VIALVAHAFDVLARSVHHEDLRPAMPAGDEGDLTIGATRRAHVDRCIVGEPAQVRALGRSAVDLAVTVASRAEEHPAIADRRAHVEAAAFDHRLAGALGVGDVQQMKRVTKLANGAIKEEVFDNFSFVPMVEGKK